ncbi:MAG: hypothetical protein ACRD1R_11670 [Acidobacteriota bacterium]
MVSYRDALKLFLRFASDRVGKPVDKLAVEDFDQKLAVAFLDHLIRGEPRQLHPNPQQPAGCAACLFPLCGGPRSHASGTLSADLRDSHQAHPSPEH